MPALSAPFAGVLGAPPNPGTGSRTRAFIPGSSFQPSKFATRSILGYSASRLRSLAMVDPQCGRSGKGKAIGVLAAESSATCALLVFWVAMILCPFRLVPPHVRPVDCYLAMGTHSAMDRVTFRSARARDLVCCRSALPGSNLRLLLSFDSFKGRVICHCLMHIRACICFWYKLIPGTPTFRRLCLSKQSRRGACLVQIDVYGFRDVFQVFVVHLV
jgi:hypothetical protein